MLRVGGDGGERLGRGPEQEVVDGGLPPGDRAVMATSGGAMMLALVADGQACARFLAPDFIQTMLIQVGKGITVGLGTPL